MGSGYSTLFAKHLACGALPLGEVQVQETGLRTMTILIDGSTLQAIKVGKRISFSHHSGRDNRAINTLYGMPSSTFTAVYAHPELKDDDSTRNGGKQLLVLPLAGLFLKRLGSWRKW
jgi:hypothetical protein